MRGRIVVLQNADLTNSLRVSLKTLDSRKVKMVGMNMTTGGGGGRTATHTRKRAGNGFKEELCFEWRKTMALNDAKS